MSGDPAQERVLLSGMTPPESSRVCFWTCSFLHPPAFETKGTCFLPSPGWRSAAGRGGRPSARLLGQWLLAHRLAPSCLPSFPSGCLSAGHLEMFMDYLCRGHICCHHTHPAGSSLSPSCCSQWTPALRVSSDTGEAASSFLFCSGSPSLSGVSPAIMCSVTELLVC